MVVVVLFSSFCFFSQLGQLHFLDIIYVTLVIHL
ncbi:unnamed protein product [Acanthoscelides obtectus]|uniref:Uncharacterized protein n=1 Tax=Acanthoscelides obtectus TaxID=200917 RepID=A0A9P0LRL7_ACAOB|nr:unnamed protein product [Acanthoscelides obtectus]CAK1657378.1 hypothetical protein AOBTE_LOCUS20319 [Acanthoscelides obtectus]